MTNLEQAARIVLTALEQADIAGDTLIWWDERELLRHALEPPDSPSVSPAQALDQLQCHLDYLRKAMRESLKLSTDAPDEDIIDCAGEQAQFLTHYERCLTSISRAAGVPLDGSEMQWADMTRAVVQLLERLRAPSRATPEEEPDEEMTPHRFIAMSGDANENWCSECEYYRDHQIHAASCATSAPEEQWVYTLKSLAQYLGWGDLTDEAAWKFMAERERLLRGAQGLLEVHRSDAVTAEGAIRDRIERLSRAESSVPPTSAPEEP